MIRVAVLGAGHWGPNLIRSFHTHQASEVAWVVDVDAERMAQVHSRYPDVRVSSRPEDALHDPAVDAVVVCTPTVTHYALARAALAVLPTPPLYARVDAVTTDAGLRIMELELIEPTLWLAWQPPAADALAASIMGQLTQSP